MNLDHLVLALAMGLVTYPSRAMPLLAPGADRWPPIVVRYLGLMGPAVLASLASSNAAVASSAGGAASLRLGVEVAAVVTCIVLIRWRGSLLVGIAGAVALAAGARAAGLA